MYVNSKHTVEVLTNTLLSLPSSLSPPLPPSPHTQMSHEVHLEETDGTSFRVRISTFAQALAKNVPNVDSQKPPHVGDIFTSFPILSLMPNLVDAFKAKFLELEREASTGAEEGVSRPTTYMPSSDELMKDFQAIVNEAIAVGWQPLGAPQFDGGFLTGAGLLFPPTLPPSLVSMLYTYI